MRIGTEDPWALTELAKAGGSLPLGALVCDGAITGWLGHGYLRMRDCGSTLHLPSTALRTPRPRNAL